jgi:deoxyribodipyrimidine photo-lyase
VLDAQPHSVNSSLRPEFDAMPWRSDEDALAAWRTGCTGYPLVDAGMRQLAETGWMHNRARLVCASFLTKHLLLDWRVGAAWFEEHLADYDVASNVFNWQWVAGSGADAAPYFRMFNPTIQGERFDPEGAYVKRWVSGLGSEDYPQPVIDHRDARQRALAAYQSIRT